MGLIDVEMINRAPFTATLCYFAVSKPYFLRKNFLAVAFSRVDCFSRAYLGLFLWKNYKAYFFPWLLLVCQGICNRQFQLFIMHGEAMFGFWMQ